MKNILLIDDDHLTNYINRRILQRTLPGVEITEFTSGYKALDHLRVNRSSLDKEWLMFLDINMPLMSGWEVLDILDTEFPEISAQVVMLTSSIDQADREKAARYSKVLSFVSKPMDRNKIQGLLRLIPNSKERKLA